MQVQSFSRAWIRFSVKAFGQAKTVNWSQACKTAIRHDYKKLFTTNCSASPRLTDSPSCKPIKIFSLSQNQTIYANGQLAEKIIAARAKEDKKCKYVKAICSEDFLIDPITHLMHEMIQRGVGRARMDDGARAFVISQIPGFIEKVGSLNHLRSFAIHYFQNNFNRFRIMQVFEKSLLNNGFQRDLKSAIDSFNGGALYFAENSLRKPLTIYYQSAQLEEYAYPEHANAE